MDPRLAGEQGAQCGQSEEAGLSFHLSRLRTWKQNDDGDAADPDEMVDGQREDHQNSQSLVVFVWVGDGFANLRRDPQIHRRQSHSDQVSRFLECR